MKIGVISSWNENIKLFSFLQKYDHEYVFVYDQDFFPYSERKIETVIERITKTIAYLKKQWIEKFILSPLFELLLLKEKNKEVLPLFSTYVLQQCFTHSLIGKIWFLWDYNDIEEWQKLLVALAKQYEPTDTQKRIKKFHYPFAYRKKETWIFKHFISYLSTSDFLVNSVLKFDLRYFKDAWVDTVLPFNYCYFHFQKTIKKFFNFKKIKFHWLETLEDVFVSLAKSWPCKKHSLTIYYSWMKDLLERDKKMMSILIPWGNVTWKKLI